MTRNMSEATKISRKEAEGIRKGKRQTSIDEMHPKNSEKDKQQKREISLGPLVRISFNTEVKENRLTNRAGDLSVIDFHYSRC
jgi:hypothetical protein